MSEEGVPMNTAYFRQMAQYNAWANGRIYTAAAELSDGGRHAQRPSFFGSIHATLNHILVGDRLWLSRLVNQPAGISALDQELYDDFEELRAARVTEDGRLVAIVDSYADADLADNLTYRNMAGEAKSVPMVQGLGPIFHHQTPH